MRRNRWAAVMSLTTVVLAVVAAVAINVAVLRGDPSVRRVSVVSPARLAPGQVVEVASPTAATNTVTNTVTPTAANSPASAASPNPAPATTAPLAAPATTIPPASPVPPATGAPAATVLMPAGAVPVTVASPPGSSRQAAYQVMDAALVTLDIHRGSLALAAVTPGDGWSVVRTDIRKLNQVELTFRLAHTDVDFTATLVRGVVSTEVDFENNTDDLIEDLD